MKKKKGCCLFTLIKYIVIACVSFFIAIFALGFVANLFSDKKPTAAVEATAAPVATAAPTAAPTAQPTAEPTAAPTEAPKAPKIPGIDGSHAYDPIIALESKGIAKPKTLTTEDGIFEWSSESVWIGSTLVSYQIHANEKHEILDATFTMSGQDNGFLSYAASLPYAAAEKEKAVQFVKDHMTGDSASMTIGDAIFSVYPNERGAMLEIKDIDSDAFYSELLDKKLGL